MVLKACYYCKRFSESVALKGPCPWCYKLPPDRTIWIAYGLIGLVALFLISVIIGFFLM